METYFEDAHVDLEFESTKKTEQKEKRNQNDFVFG